MSNVEALRTMRAEPLFPSWSEYPEPEQTEAASEAVGALIDGLIAMGPNADEGVARGLVDECVLRLNDLDERDGNWIETMEREDLCELIYRAVELTGFAPDEDWVGERDW